MSEQKEAVENAQASQEEQQITLKQAVFMQNVKPVIDHLHQVCIDNGIPCTVNAIVVDQIGGKEANFHASMNNIDERIAQAYPAFLIGSAFVSQDLADQVQLGDFAVEALGNVYSKINGETSVEPSEGFSISVSNTKKTAEIDS